MKRLFSSVILLAAILFAGKDAFADTCVLSVSDTTITAPVDTARDTSRYGPVMVITKDKGQKDATVKVVFGKPSDSSRPKNVTLSWLGFDLGFNNYDDRSHYGTAEVNDFVPGQPDPTADMFSLRAGKSVNVNIWPVMVKVNLVNHYLGLKTGIGVEMNNYRYTKSITYKNDISKTYIYRDSIAFKKNKLFTEYLTIPLMFTFESSPFHYSRSVHLAAGATFGYLVKSRTKQKSKERGKVKDNDPFNLEKFRTGLRAEAGYGPVTLYGAYSFTPIHRYGLEQYPFSIGIILSR